MVEIEIDGKKVEVPPGSMVMDAANKLGTYIPHFCYHKKLSIAANCRMCLVEVEKAPKPLPACATPVSAGMIVRSNSEKAVQAQKSVMEFLLINHPLDCPICDQGGECQLQDLAVGYGKSNSRYEEEKRVVPPKDAGPLISMQEMTRCIHCTRCVRFGQEVAGVMELGMLGRGEHAEITSFVGKTVDSEVSGNMIDLCPVGALTSKPFRYSARTWELSRRKSVSPHDSLGTNLIVQVKGGKVMRVLPLENDAINECWISDKDRFSYEALDNQSRLTKPMIKQGGQWAETDWQTALEYVAHGLRNIKHEHGADSIAALATAHSTVEELHLLQKAMRGIGSENIDFRLRQSDFALDGQVTPWLGMPIADLSTVKRALVIGSFIRKDHPLVATRLRAAVKGGAKLSLVHASDDELLIPTANKIIAAPSDWLAALSGIVAAVAAAKGVAAPAGFEGIEATDAAKAIAASLNTGDENLPGVVLLGNAAAHHPQASALHAAAQWIAEQTGAKFGYLTEAANTVGGYLVGAFAKNAAPVFSVPKKAYVLLNAEPELDCADPQQARAALDAAEMVVVMSAFQHGFEYADVLLPISPFSETSGTFVNCEGRAQSFNGTVKPLGDTRPAWKVLRVMGNLLGLSGFDYDTSEAIRDELFGKGVTDLSAKLNNTGKAVLKSATFGTSGALERVTDVPIYFADAIARRSEPLLRTADANAPLVTLPSALAGKLGVQAGAKVKVTQGSGSAILVAGVDARLPANTVRVASAHPATATLGAMFGAITVEKAGEGI
ncbi:NADH-quinone oxidoreductase subunit NuoG [Massilia antarctica]|uniref:NADH-quinone oxidoreductase subunit NuoG n=1 Tax=Massilia antarctica TaxID=2765360 RepID=UPI0006BB59DF|nr:NADH-quinone oxidoreductase subunit NuoG [Massilia sp. H27-R4]MCY0913876.1 NADH-quinone oxidoreductase subunit NuoG [Massilia sp. H27-R4]CUI04394.1 NADH-ubiquinone oxidoreductase chain G [Janthinobacterium sp. CG23_2]CUU28180.1 NADH-ubiquinone oxidoreductase chain G [Janthinobacterium sp. CG23_2]